MASSHSLIAINFGTYITSTGTKMVPMLSDYIYYPRFLYIVHIKPYLSILMNSYRNVKQQIQHQHSKKLP